MKKSQAANYSSLNRRGFTLVELMVVVAITVILSTILLARTRQPTRELELKVAAQNLSADLRGVQGLALSGGSVSCGGVDMVPYYGLRIQADSSGQATYYIFADCNRNNIYDSSSNDFITNTITLNNIFVNSTTPASGGADWLDIVYSPPGPSVAIDGSIFSYPNTGEFTIELCHIGITTLCSSVKGNTRGNVEIE